MAHWLSSSVDESSFNSNTRLDVLLLWDCRFPGTGLDRRTQAARQVFSTMCHNPKTSLTKYHYSTIPTSIRTSDRLIR